MDSDDEYIDAISKILCEDSYRVEMQKNIEKNIKPRLWSNIARDHLKVYESVINVPYGRARYFYMPDVED